MPQPGVGRRGFARSNGRLRAILRSFCVFSLWVHRAGAYRFVCGGAELAPHFDLGPAVADGFAHVGVELGDGVDQHQREGHRDQQLDERERAGRLGSLLKKGSGSEPRTTLAHEDGSRRRA